MRYAAATIPGEGGEVGTLSRSSFFLRLPDAGNLHVRFDELVFLLHRGEWRNGGTVQWFSVGRKLRAVARTVPALFKGVPMHDATHMGAGRGSIQQDQIRRDDDLVILPAMVVSCGIV
jgi:hypothetical protein